tara:strand:- start:87 stop:371 length:285 start_codon:yes stop_codon:yes gene_type:complete
MKQQQKVIEYFIQNNNEPKHFEKVAQELGILIPNMRRILGQGTLKGIFNRVDVGVYEFAHYETEKEITINELENVLSSALNKAIERDNYNYNIK